MANITLKRLAQTIGALIVYIVVSDLLIHGMVLQNTYQATAHLWRPQEEMGQYMVWMLVGQVFIGVFFGILFAKGYEGKGLMEGVRFGLYLAGVTVGGMLIQFSVSPLPASLLLAWVAFGIVQTIGAGLVAAAVYGRK